MKFEETIREVHESKRVQEQVEFYLQESFDTSTTFINDAPNCLVEQQ